MVDLKERWEKHKKGELGVRDSPSIEKKSLNPNDYIPDFIGGQQRKAEERYEKWKKDNQERTISYGPKTDSEEDVLQAEIKTDLVLKNRRNATEKMTQYIKSKEFIYSTKDDIKSEMWIYEDGIYKENGQSMIRETCRRVMQEIYTTTFVNEVIAKVEADTYIDYDEFFNQNNEYKDEIPVENGILNIHTKELSPFTPQKVFFGKIPIKYDGNAKCPKIEKFLIDVLPTEDDLKVIYEFAGYCLLKDNRYDKAVMMTANGSNGKTQVLNLFKKFIGDGNYQALPLTSLTTESFDLGELFGKFLNIVGDLSSNALKETGRFKELSSGDPVTVKRKFKRTLTFNSYAKFLFSCNELPMVYDLSKGFWRRWILLEFPYTFVTKKEYKVAKDKTNLKIKRERIIDEITTKEELSGFLNKAIEGLINLIKNKDFSKTKGAEETKGSWLRKANSFIGFFHDRLEEDYNGKVEKSVLRRLYSEYCREHKVNSKSDIVIKRVLNDYGIVDERTYESIIGEKYWWIGVKIKASGRLGR